jgi:hypothetical protein
MKKYISLTLLGCLVLLSSCNNNPAWIGKGDAKADELAAETCKCVYTEMEKDESLNLPAIMEAVKALHEQHKDDLHDAVFDSENADVKKAIAKEEDFSLMLDECECMKPVQDALLEKGVPFEEMMSVLDKKCLLGAFYN